jgi:7-cyano-7-deazaguanine tRNA-ribosyltransferase
VLVIAGLSLKNLNPRVWDSASPYHLPNLRAVMVSYAEFHQMPAQRRRAMADGLHAHLGVPNHIRIYLDNGAFYFLAREGETAVHDYAAFVAAARPDWYPVPRDFIPVPAMSLAEQTDCLTRTMAMNEAFRHDGFVPIMHISEIIDDYIDAFRADAQLLRKPAIALGGIVPNLLRRPKARPYREVLASVQRARTAFPGKEIHLFGIGGTATLHIAALLGMDSVDSSGWRNRAARGIVQLPGSGDRVVANLGSWRGRSPSEAEWNRLRKCPCAACQQFGPESLQAGGKAGFAHRATHNLWVLLNEAELIRHHQAFGDYLAWIPGHLDNTIYRPIIEELATKSPSPTAVGEGLG